MAPTLARLLVLLSSLALMGLAPVGILRPLPGETRAGAPPELPDWRALAVTPAPAPPPEYPRAMALRPAATLPELGHFSDPAFLAELADRQGREVAEALVLLRGTSISPPWRAPPTIPPSSSAGATCSRAARW